MKDVIARHKTDIADRVNQISQLEEECQRLQTTIDQKHSEKQDFEMRIKDYMEGTLRRMIY